jgi:hypothetical protein
MRRKLVYLLICMPLCLLLVPDRRQVALSITQDPQDHYQDDGKGLPTEDRFAKLAAEDPVAMLDASLKRQHREIHGYSGVLHKTERMKGKLQTPEVIDFWFREQPYSVLMKWKAGNRGGRASLYVQGENKERVAVLTKVGLVVDLDPDGRLVADGARYPIREFSMRQGTDRAYHAWKAAKEKGILKTEYLGKKPVPELDNRVCYLVKRTCNPPEEEGLVTVSIAIDAETWLQIGSTLTDGQGQLIGQYNFTALKINPTFAPDQFERAMLKK